MKTKSQVPLNNCLMCGRQNVKFLLCNVCRENPFLVEKARKKTIDSNDKNLFRKLYSKDYAELRNNNSKDFWNKHFETELQFNDQDRMTKDKIEKICSFIPKKECRVLDIGFGQGYFEELAESKRKDINIVGIDISTQAVEKASKNFRGQFIEGDLHRIKYLFAKNYFDVILAIEVMEHVLPTKIFSFLEDVSGLIKPHGILIISTPLNEHLDKLKTNPSGHVREYTIPVLKKELEISGFKVIDTYTFYAFRRFYTIKKFLSKIFRNRWEENNVVVRAVRK